jgi:hypothetical protein
MNAPNQLDQALEALRQEHRSLQPPPALEASLLKQAELTRPRPTHTLRNWSLALAAAAALVVAVVLLYPRSSHPVTQTQTIPPPQPPKAMQAPTPIATAAQDAAPHPQTKHRPATPRRQNTSNDFVPLPAGMGLPEPQQAMLIRTRIDTSSLRNYGLASPPAGAPPTILAEFLVGEDGLPRAIRLVP